MHSQGCRENSKIYLRDRFRTRCFRSAMRPRIAFIGIKMLRCRDLLKLNGMALARSSSSIPECDCRKIRLIGGVLSENFSRIN
jgi:hypothetical protein